MDTKTLDTNWNLSIYLLIHSLIFSLQTFLYDTKEKWKIYKGPYY